MSLSQKLADIERHWIDKGSVAQSNGSAVWLEWCAAHETQIMEGLVTTNEYKEEVARLTGEHYRREYTDAERIIMLESSGERILSAWADDGVEDVDLGRLMEGVKMMARCLGLDVKDV